MNQDEKIQFVLDLTMRVAKTVCDEIKAGEVPDSWSPAQLGMYVGEMMCEEVDKR